MEGFFFIQARQNTAKVILGVLILVSISQLLMPVSNYIQDDTASNQAYWLSLAKKAWQFFEPGQALNTQTGLHSASLDWPYFTEWDLGTYIQTMLDARKLGILQDSGQWGFDNRIGKIIEFLKNRQLTNNNVPYLIYDSRTGEPYQDTPSFSIDEGKLYLALYKLSEIRPGLKQDITNIVKVRTNNTDLVPDPKSWLYSTDLYCYYIAHAFKAWQFEGWNDVPSSIMGTILSQPNITTYGVKLPSAHICSEPMLATTFEVNPQDARFDWLASQVYLAHEARYMATGHYTAFSEGNTGYGNPSYVYEFVVDNYGSTWRVEPRTTPIAFLKVAVGFHAIVNTEYSKNLVGYINKTLPASSGGFQEGVDENGRVVYSHIDRTNGLIISAARYVIDNFPEPAPSPTASPIADPTSTASPLSPTEVPTVLPTSTPDIPEFPSAILTIAISMGAIGTLFYSKKKKK